ncbi:hypothetical protein K443DRAFT_116606, partial [Laccaria amethystina LaAM-08-1]
HSGIYTGMVFPGMGRNGIPLEFQWNSVLYLFVTDKQCLFGDHATQTRPLSSSHHHQPCSPTPPTMFVTTTALRDLPRWTFPHHNHRHAAPRCSTTHLTSTDTNDPRAPTRTIYER